jgi:hypothetical protein
MRRIGRGWVNSPQLSRTSAGIPYVDQGYTGDSLKEAAQTHGIELEVIKLSSVKRGFVVLSRRRVIEPNLAWANRLRRLAREDERFPKRSLACISSRFRI